MRNYLKVLFKFQIVQYLSFLSNRSLNHFLRKMHQMNSPEFNIKFNSKPSQQHSATHSIKEPQQSQQKFLNNSNDQNADPNTSKNNENNVFQQYETLINALKSNEYTIDILNSNINHLEKEFVKKDQVYLAKAKQVQKLKKINAKTTEAIRAEKHRTKKLNHSNQSNLEQLKEVETQLKNTFQERLKSQQHKNEIYQQYKDLEDEYSRRIEQLEKFCNKNFQTEERQSPKAKDQNYRFGASSQRNIMKQQLQKLRQENNNIFPTKIQNNEQKLQQLQSKLQWHLENRQNIKTNIQKITESIKSLEHEQYQHQLTIDKLQKQKAIFIKNQQKVLEKNEYLNHLFDQVDNLRAELDQKCEEKYGLFKYFKEVEKEEKNLRKLRKIQIECSKEQDLYKQQRNQQFAVLQSEKDPTSPENVSKETWKSSKEKGSQSPQFNLMNQSTNSAEVQRFDTETRERISHIIQKYQNLKSRRRN